MVEACRLEVLIAATRNPNLAVARAIRCRDAERRMNRTLVQVEIPSELETGSILKVLS